MFFMLFHFIRGVWIKFKVILINFSFLLLLCFGLLILSCSLIEGFIGYVLIFGNMSYWGLNVIINLICILPFLFLYIFIEVLWSSSIFICNRIFMLHFILAFIILSLILIHLLFLHSISSNNAQFKYNKSTNIVPFYLYLLKDYVFGLLIIGFILSFLCYYKPHLIGNYNNNLQANPLSTPNNIIPESYYLLFYALLRLMPSLLSGVILVFIYFLVLIIYFINSSLSNNH